ncbi:MAG: hydantoinase B/oxoprolinase family protein [Chloroflexota bacterium]
MSHATRAAPHAPDPVAFELLHTALLSVTDEMGAALRRSSYSPIIREMLDYSCAIFDHRGRLVVQGDFIPAQLGAMSLVVQEVLARHSPSLARGDVFIANDPYAGGAHTPDVNVIRPIFGTHEGRHARPSLLAFSASVAHQVDFGGRNPGTEGADNLDLFHEGLVLPPVHLSRAGTPVTELFDLIAANVRDPISTLADLRAQMASCLAGERRLLELAADWSVPTLRSAFAQALRTAEQRTRRALAALPGGSSEAEGYLDDDGAGGAPTRVHARLEKLGDELTVDLSGTAMQVAGGINNPWSSTRACVAYLLKAVTDQDAPQNDGSLRPVTIVCPEGSLLNPRRPAAVSVRHLTCQRLADVLLAAAGRLWPELRIGASFVGFFSIMAAGPSPKTGRTVVIQDVVGGGSGAHGPHGDRPGGPGTDGVDTYMSNVALLPAEVCEIEYPWRLVRSELVDGSEGRGRWHGGRGLRRTYQVLGEASQRVVLYCEQTNPAFRPRGAAGGGGGTSTRLEVRDPRGGLLPVASKATVTLDPGSTVTIITGGGGGWGAPGRRA